MKKLLPFVFTVVLLLGLTGCTDSKIKVWDWAQSLNQEDIASVEIWSIHDGNHLYEPVNDEKTLELITTLNKLTKASFTENKHLAGITPTVGIRIKISSETYNINYAPSPYGKYGMLEIGYHEKMWWIDNAELLDCFLSITENKPTE